MPAAARLGDKGQVQADAHGCPACPHPGVGPIVAASSDVFVNDRPAARKDDIGIHAACCGPNTFSIKKGSASVYVNGKPFARMNDDTTHCGGNGNIIEGSPDVLIDDGASGQGLGSYLIHQLAILLRTTAAFKRGTRKARSDTHQTGAPAQQQNLASTPSQGSVTSAQWSVQRATRDDDVQLLIECTANLKGSLSIDIWSLDADGTPNTKVHSLQQNAAQHIKAKWRVAIPANAANRNEVDFCFVVKDSGGAETTSDPMFVPLATDWVEMEMVDHDDKPVPDVRFKLTTANGREIVGRLDSNGHARIEGVRPGSCTLTFPDLPPDAWN